MELLCDSCNYTDVFAPGPLTARSRQLSRETVVEDGGEELAAAEDPPAGSLRVKATLRCRVEDGGDELAAVAGWGLSVDTTVAQTLIDAQFSSPVSRRAHERNERTAAARATASVEAVLSPSPRCLQQGED